MAIGVVRRDSFMSAKIPFLRPLGLCNRSILPEGGGALQGFGKGLAGSFRQASPIRRPDGETVCEWREWAV